MQYKKISLGGETQFLRLKELKAGYEVEGVYTRTLTNDFGPTYIVETPDGDVGIPGSGKLNRLMAAVSPGSAIKVVYNGIQKLESGKFKGKDFHDFDVFAAEVQETPSTPTKKANLSKVS